MNTQSLYTLSPLPEADVPALNHDFILERDKVQHFLVSALAKINSPNLVFKGGTLLRVCIFENYRFSEDLDFDWTSTAEEFSNIMEQAATLASRKSGYFLEFPLDRKANRQVFRWDAGEISGNIKIDKIIVNKNAIPPVNNWHINGLWDTNHSKQTICGYSLSSIIADKLRAVVNRSEPRDIYDLYHIMQTPKDIAQGLARYNKNPRDPRRPDVKSPVLRQLASHILNKHNDYMLEWPKFTESGLVEKIVSLDTALLYICETIDNYIQT